MSEETGREEPVSRGKKIGFIVLVVAVILMLIQLALYLTTGGEDDEASEGASESVSAVDTPDDKGDAYVDDSGA